MVGVGDGLSPISAGVGEGSSPTGESVGDGVTSGTGVAVGSGVAVTTTVASGSGEEGVASGVGDWQATNPPNDKTPNRKNKRLNIVSSLCVE